MKDILKPMVIHGAEIEIIKQDVLKLINKVEELEQMIINLTYKRKKEKKLKQNDGFWELALFFIVTYVGLFLGLLLL